MTEQTPRQTREAVTARTHSAARLVAACAFLAVASVAEPAVRPDASALADAQALFYNARYAEAAAATDALFGGDTSLPARELRTAAVLFQLRRAIGEPQDKDRAFKACVRCADLYADFMVHLAAGQREARAALKAHPGDPETLFLLGKLDLNYVWLVLGTLGRRTGWDEYWEARRSLDAALKLEPVHMRARVARAWIDYIVDTRTPWGTGWLLGGGNKKRALAVMRTAASEPGDFYDAAEALFGLWDMQVRERRFTEALESARRLSVLFPENPDVARFVASRTNPQPAPGVD